MAPFPPCALQHHLLLHGPPCRCPSFSITITTHHATALSPFKDVHLCSLGRIHAGKVLEAKPQRGPTKVKRGRDHDVGSRELGDNSSPSARLEESAERERSKKAESDSMLRERGSRALIRKEKSGLRKGDSKRNEIGTQRIHSAVFRREMGDRNENKNRVSSENGIDGSDNKSKSEVDADNKKGNVGKKSKVASPKNELRIGLDMCSKKGDVMGAISLYDAAISDGIRIEQYHYNVLLYLCSSAALGAVHPGKSGSNSSGGGSSMNAADSPNETTENFESADGSRMPDEINAASEPEEGGANEDDNIIRVSEDVQSYASKRGLEIYERMCSESISLNEAALTSVARMAMAVNDGDSAFTIVEKIKELGLTLRLRSYGPALLSFCNSGDISKAFQVEKHMLECGIQPEEPELFALLNASIRALDSEKIYYLLHKLRTNVRQVSPRTAELIETWFSSPLASRVGKRKWNTQQIALAMANVGGGWHGLGWLGKGKWHVVRGEVDADGVCQSCSEKLVAIDIDPAETENFADSVASIAVQRERHSSFQKFQRWLDYYGPFEAVIDAANVGLFSQRQFSVIKVNAVVNGIRQMLPSKRWPLIIVHNRRLHGGKMEEAANKKLVEKWKNADAIYATPTGSNDDWYWLYAAVKCKSLIVTNDEMRDHNFQILGNDFFPKWKERHQVRFNFQDGGPQFSLPPACSVVIQESERGHWHIPISSGQECGTGRTWLCLTRTQAIDKPSPNPLKGTLSKKDVKSSDSNTRERHLMKNESGKGHDEISSNSQHSEIVRIFKDMLSSKVTVEHRSIATDLERAEEISGHVIDFEI